MNLETEHISTLRQVTCLITCQAGENIDLQIGSALQTLTTELGARAAAIYWQEGGRLTCRYHYPAEYVHDQRTHQRLSRPVRLNQVIRPVGNVFWLAVPMRVGGQALGRLWVLCNPGRFLSAAEQELLLLAGNQLALALENARMCQEISLLAERRGALLRRLIELHEERSRSLAASCTTRSASPWSRCFSMSIPSTPLTQLRRRSCSPTWSGCAQGSCASLTKSTGSCRILRPSLLEDHGLEAALRRVASERRQSSDTEIHLHLASQPGRLAPHLETAIYRIGQEALSNVARHAKAANVWVDLVCDDGKCKLTIRDDGAGFDVRSILEHPRGMQSVGLIGMQERAEQVGGRVIIKFFFRRRHVGHGDPSC